MITAPTAPGRTFVTRVGPILIEEHRGPTIGKMPGKDPHPEARIVTLTNRETGAVIQLDETMLDFMFDQLIPPSVRMAHRIQTRYNAIASGGCRLEVKAETAHVSGDHLSVEATLHVNDGIHFQGMVGCPLVAGDLDFDGMGFKSNDGIIPE